MRHTRSLERRRAMRAQMTLPEVLLWKGLKGRRLGAQFRRQHPFGPYILDFYCEALKLAIEVDGSSHEWTVERDVRRDAYLAAQGVRTVRIAARAILADVDVVVGELREALAAAAPSDPSGATSPAPQGRILDD